MTIQDVKNNYEFKATVKALKHEFPWIKGVSDITDPETYTSLIFLTGLVDLSILIKEYNVKLASYVRYYLTKGQPYTFTYLRSAVVNTEEESPEFNKLEQEVKEFLDAIHKSKTIPEPMKLPKPLMISGWDAVPLSKSKYPELITYTNEDRDATIGHLMKNYGPNRPNQSS